MKITTIFTFIITSILIMSCCATITARSYPPQDNLSSSFNVSVTKDIVQHEGDKALDWIKKLPGQPENTKFNQYGGYITVDKEHGRAFYYYFVEIDNDHHHSDDSTPLVLWLNGGPGCSSLLGAWSEVGPFRVKSNGNELYNNPYAWNKVANVLFLETPAGVGFSYSNTTSDSTTGDQQTAIDNYVFLINWLERFPEYKDRDLFLTGESYAGHYIPQLAEKILEHNKNLTNSNRRTINLKGIAVGNPLLEETLDQNGKWVYKFLNRHDFITDEEYEGLLKSCDFSVASPIYPSRDCLDKMYAAERIRSDAEHHFDFYNIYAPLCHLNNITNEPNEISVGYFDPCTENYMSYYLNIPEVRLALHADITMFGNLWQKCSIDKVSSNWEDRTTVVPILSTLSQNNIRILVYSGDIDLVVPYTVTREVLKELNLTQKVGRTPWYSNNEFAGISEAFEGGLTVATVRGAGHMVPSYQPERALTMITCFLKGQPLPDHP